MTLAEDPSWGIGREGRRVVCPTTYSFPERKIELLGSKRELIVSEHRPVFSLRWSFGAQG